MDIATFFKQPKSTLHRQYEALRALYVEEKSADEVAKQFGYTKTSIYSLTRDFKKQVQENKALAQLFFNESVRGRKPAEEHDELRELIILLRKKYLSVSDIKSILDAQNKTISERHIYNIIHAEGFARLPRRSKSQKQTARFDDIVEAPKTQLLIPQLENFNSSEAGLLLFMLYIKRYGLDKLIENSDYPETIQLPRLNSILAFVALKLVNIKRYTADDLWCMDRGLGLFAGLNVLPKAAWFTSYSSRVTRSANVTFLKQMHAVWAQHGLLSDTANLDFVTVPYWGEEQHLENNWSGTRHHALCSMLAVLAQDPDSGLITYGDSSVRHANESQVIIEFLDFYKANGADDLKYLVFDSKFTTYENLRKLDDNQVKFITIRRRGKKIVGALEALPSSEWKRIRVPMSKGKTRCLTINEQTISIKHYGKPLRQVAITGHGKIKPALIITNDFDVSPNELVRKYARRWLVEKTISEQTHFFHLNRLSSSMVIKVDFDLTMTILAHNLYRLFASDAPGFEHCTAQSLYEKFIRNEGLIHCNEKEITIKLKKKRRLPIIIEALQQHLPVTIPWLGHRVIKVEGASIT